MSQPIWLPMTVTVGHHGVAQHVTEDDAPPGQALEHGGADVRACSSTWTVPTRAMRAM